MDKHLLEIIVGLAAFAMINIICYLQMKLYFSYANDNHPGMMSWNPGNWFASEARQKTWYHPEGYDLLRKVRKITWIGIIINIFWIVILRPYSF